MRVIRRLAARLVRGPDADLIRLDLEELYQRDRVNGAPIARAHARFARRLIGSLLSVVRARARRPRLPGVSLLDIKLAGRMLIRYPGLSVVAGLAMAIGIPLAIAPMQLANAINAPLPYPERDRIVGLEHILVSSGHDEPPTLHDFERWRATTRSFASLAAAIRRRENVGVDGGLIAVRTGTEMTASAFDIPRVAPLLGRTLLASDESLAAPPVAVIGHDLWQSHFGGAPDVLGRTLRVGRTHRAVVGVMPAGFQFPYRDEFWVPLQRRASDYPAGQGPGLAVFGRLRDGVSRARALAELTAIDAPLATEHPDVYARMKPDVTELNYVVTGLTATFDRVYPAYVISMLLLGVACANVGTLMLARTAGRATEVAVRAALGAGRARIVMQLFIESLVLSTLAGAVGLATVELALRRLSIVQRLEGTMPPWFDLNVTPVTILLAAAMALFSAVVAGLMPALRATGKRGYIALQRAAPGGGGLRFGLVASVLIVAEVAVAVAGLSGVGSIAKGAFRSPSFGEGIAAAEYLTTQLTLPPAEPGTRPLATAEAAQKLAVIQTESVRRLLAQPGVRAVTFASHLPGMQHFRTRIEVDDRSGRAHPAQGYTVNSALVDRTYFEALGQPILLGRGFETRDLVPRGRSAAVVVNRSFVAQVLRGAPPLGSRIREVRPPNERPGPWREIIGVVNDLGMNIVDPAKAAGIYYVVSYGQLAAPHLVVRVAEPPSVLVPRLRTILGEVEPAMVVDNPVPLDEVFSELLVEARFTAIVFVLVAIIGVVLSAAGLYALMSFSVAQRTREIAIRTALGARPARIIHAVVRRALLQLGAGVAMGVGLGVAIIPEIVNDATMAGNWRAMVAAVSVAMVAIGLLACALPTRRALRIQAIQALKDV